jgi:hypothetical protein
MTGPARTTRPGRRRRAAPAAAALALALAGLLAAAAPPPGRPSPGAGDGPAGGRVRAVVGACVLEAPPELRVHLDRLAARAAVLLPHLEAEIGARPAAPYRILLIPAAPGDDPEIRALDGLAPAWAAGFVLPHRRVGAIRVARADRYPYADLASVLVHEATHMLLHDAAGAGLPRWFGEGVATALERQWGMRDVLVYSSALLTGPLPRLDRLDPAFDGGGPEARAAYAAAFDFLRATRRRHGDRVVRVIVREAGARPFPEAWKAATGEPLARSEAAWRRGSLIRYRWIPVLTGTGALWGGITALALAAIARHRVRRRAILERWEMEERLRPPDQEGGTR